jgi:L-lactate dehydrogenase complex protein LldG
MRRCEGAIWATRKSVTTKNQFLETVRKALGRSMPVPSGTPPRPAAEFPTLGDVLAPVAEKEYIGRFEDELRKVGGITHQAQSPGQLDDTLRDILAPAGAGQVVLSRNPLLRRLRLADRVQAWGYPVVSWPPEKDVAADELAQFRSQCFSAKAGITGTEFALVESGTFVLTSVTEGTQLVSLAPPLHIVLYRRSQVVECLEEVLSRLCDARSNPSAVGAGRSIVFITGQSRTADIEQISIRGVHGPLSIHAILVEESCLILDSDRD